MAVVVLADPRLLHRQVLGRLVLPAVAKRLPQRRVVLHGLLWEAKNTIHKYRYQENPGFGPHRQGGSLELPVSLSAADRAMAHSVADGLGLQHQSFGEGQGRFGRIKAASRFQDTHSKNAQSGGRSKYNNVETYTE